ncbi:MAG: SDR family oxidoreductase [Acidobacteriota bacterium]
MLLKGKRVIVTGGTKGIGVAIARVLVQEGAAVIVAARTGADVDRTAAELSPHAPSPVLGRACDVGDPEQVKGLIDFCARNLGGLDILINNAGVGIFQTVADLSIESWQQTVRTNLDGVFYCCHYALPLLKRANGGFIITISSLAGRNAFPRGAAYNATKFGLTGFSEALMQEVRHDDIRVAYIMPGSVNTWFGGSPPEDEDSWKLSAQDVAQVVLETLCRPPRCLTSRIEMRPSRPPQKG